MDIPVFAVNVPSGPVGPSGPLGPGVPGPFTDIAILFSPDDYLVTEPFTSNLPCMNLTTEVPEFNSKS